MTESFDPYATLGVSSDAASEQIKAAYHTLAKKHHPDAGGDVEVMAAVNRAYEVLSDPGRRQVFDDFGVIRGDDLADLRLSAIASIKALFIEMLSQVEPAVLEKADLMRSMQMSADHRMGQLEDELAKATAARDKEIQKLEIIRKRMKTKTRGTPNIFIPLLQQVITQLNVEVDKLEKHVRVTAEIQRLLGDYEFDFERVMQLQTRCTFTAHISTAAV